MYISIYIYIYIYIYLYISICIYIYIYSAKKYLTDGLAIFIIGAAQNYARKYTMPIDHVGFEFFVLDENVDLRKPPDDGVYIKV